MVSKAYLQGLLEQIAIQTKVPGADQTEYSESGSSLNDQRENELAQIIIMYENPNHPIMVQHDFLGQGGQTRCNIEAPCGKTGKTVPRVSPIANRITRSNLVIV